MLRQPEDGRLGELPRNVVQRSCDRINVVDLDTACGTGPRLFPKDMELWFALSVPGLTDGPNKLGCGRRDIHEQIVGSTGEHLGNIVLNIGGRVSLAPDGGKVRQQGPPGCRGILPFRGTFPKGLSDSRGVSANDSTEVLPRQFITLTAQHALQTGQGTAE